MHGPVAKQEMQPASMLRAVSAGLRALEKATDPAEVLDIERKLEAIEHMMRNTGLFKPEQVREANEGKIRARWKLGKLLAKIGKGKPGPKGVISHGGKQLMGLYKEWGLDKNRAAEAQKIGALPETKLDKVLAEYHGTADFMTFRELIIYARPFWHQEKRKDTHARIVAQAKNAKVPDKLGPFALIYWDPPWVFETHTPAMTHRMPDDHYPTLTDQQIIDVTFHGQSIERLAHRDCAMFMWCTSSNLKRAIAVMETLGFEYKTHAMWDKKVIGLGLIFRNQHEVLLYGSRGKPPKPVKLFSSVFCYRRTKHSAKPPQVRRALEQMYPMFTEADRVELFVRGEVKGWAALGHEAAD